MLFPTNEETFEHKSSWIAFKIGNEAQCVGYIVEKCLKKLKWIWLSSMKVKSGKII